MRDIKIEPRDKEAAKEFWNGEMAGWREQSERQAALILAFARHRQAAEKAQQERDAAYIEGKMKHYQAKIDKTDPDDVELIEMRQHTVEALEVIAYDFRS